MLVMSFSIVGTVSLVKENVVFDVVVHFICSGNKVVGHTCSWILKAENVVQMLYKLYCCKSGTYVVLYTVRSTLVYL